jgi:hypothetical protein
MSWPGGTGATAEIQERMDCVQAYVKTFYIFVAYVGLPDQGFNP